jgi:mannose/fructose/N-acetylgalactosamine-specific phosphotransferase system component IIB
MQATFVRIDERMLHGQVLIGWAGRLQPRFLLLANDLIAEDPVQRRLYEALAEDEFVVQVMEVEEAAHYLADNPLDARETMVVVASPVDALALVQGGAALPSINLGGLYESTKKRRLLDYVWLSDFDIENLQQLLKRDVALEARDLPGTAAVAITAQSLQRLGHAV